MPLWLLRPRDDLVEADDPWVPWYDKAFGFVVRATTEAIARQLANAHGGAEVGPLTMDPYRAGGDPWLDAAYSTCEVLSVDGPDAWIVRDIRHAS